MLPQPQQKTIHVVIVGLGEAAETHLSVLELFPNVDVIAGVDTLGDKHVKFHGQQIPVYRTITDVPQNQHIDAAVIATPTPLHYQTCNEVLDTLPSPLQIFVEKPIASSLRQVEELVGIVDNETPIEPMLHYAYAPDVLWVARNLKRLISKYGKLTRYDAFFADPRSEDHSRLKRQVLGSSWIDLGINALSVTQRLIGVTNIKHSTLHETPLGAHFTFDTADILGSITTDWQVKAPTYETRLTFASGERVLIDHYTMSVIEGSGKHARTLFSYTAFPRRFSHYVHLYQDLLNNRDIEIPTHALLRMHQLLFNNAGVEV